MGVGLSVSTALMSPVGARGTSSCRWLAHEEGWYGLIQPRTSPTRYCAFGLARTREDTTLIVATKAPTR
jgi:hypothetical protein